MSSKLQILASKLKNKLFTMKSETLAMGESEGDDVEMGPAEFAAAIARDAVAQICESVGFSATQRSALETMTDVAARYLHALAVASAASAASSGRTESNLYDVIRALEDLASVQGFRGASNLNQPILTSSALTDLAKFVKYSDEIPFAKPIRRRFPKQSIPLPGDDQKSARSVGFLHIPRWLPPIPEMGASEIGRKVTQEDDKSGIAIGPCGEVGGSCLVGEKMRMALPERRPRVRFKMGFGLGVGWGGNGNGNGNEVRGECFGVDLRSGVCRGGKKSVMPE